MAEAPDALDLNDAIARAITPAAGAAPIGGTLRRTQARGLQAVSSTTEVAAPRLSNATSGSGSIAQTAESVLTMTRSSVKT
jgi:hypothetical protein